MGGYSEFAMSRVLRIVHIIYTAIKISKKWGIVLISTKMKCSGSRGAAVIEAPRYKTGRSRDRFPVVSLEFFIDIILPVTLWPSGRLSL
jgi:uncharacterized membrane protein